MELVQATEEERTALLAMLTKRAESAPAGAGPGRASALAWAGVKLAGVVLLAAGVAIGLGDGDEFDDVGCSTAQQPGGSSHGTRSAQGRERGGGKLPGCGGGPAGGSGDGGPYGGKAETLKAESRNGGSEREAVGPECEPRAAMRETFPTRLLLRFLQAAPEKLAALEGILDGAGTEVEEAGRDDTEIEKAESRNQEPGASAAGSRPRPPSTGQTSPPGVPGLMASSPRPSPPKAERELPAASPPGAERAGSSRYSLRRERACWVLESKAGCAQLKHEVALGYVAGLLSQPDEPVPSATLFSRFSTRRRKNLAAVELPDPETGLPVPLADGVGLAQLPPDQDEAEARSRYRAQLAEYRETMDDPAVPESERAEAQRLHDELLGFLERHYRPARDAGHAVTKLVHRAIQRLCDHLRKPMAGEKVPSPVALAFAEYVEAHILLPSRRYTRAKLGARVRIAWGELAGRLIFECPPGDRWSVRL